MPMKKIKKYIDTNYMEVHQRHVMMQNEERRFPVGSWQNIKDTLLWILYVSEKLKERKEKEMWREKSQ